MCDYYEQLHIIRDRKSNAIAACGFDLQELWASLGVKYVDVEALYMVTTIWVKMPPIQRPELKEIRVTAKMFQSEQERKEWFARLHPEVKDAEV